MGKLQTFAVALMALGVIGCASSSRVRLVGGPQAPAAEGAVKLSTGPNANTRLNISVQHLAPPERVAAGATVYVVWARPIEQGAAPQNLGALQINGNLEGVLDTVTPLRNFELLVTAEQAAPVLQPTGAPILSAPVNR